MVCLNFPAAAAVVFILCHAAGVNPAGFKALSDQHDLGLQLDGSTKGKAHLKQALGGKALSSIIGITGEAEAGRGMQVRAAECGASCWTCTWQRDLLVLCHAGMALRAACQHPQCIHAHTSE